MHLSIRWPRSFISCGLPLRGWVAVIPNRFHFVIIPLTVDCGIFRSEEISQLDVLHRWHPITVPRWNSLSSWERPIHSQMSVETVCMPRCFFYTPVAMEVIGTPGFNCLDVWVNTFGTIVYIYINMSRRLWHCDPPHCSTSVSITGTTFCVAYWFLAPYINFRVGTHSKFSNLNCRTDH